MKGVEITLGYIYKISNDVNNKVYIGKTCKTVESRFKEHLRDYQKRDEENRPLYRAMKKYGVEHFSVEEIDNCLDNQLVAREQYWIGYFDSYNNGYNATLGGDGKILYDHDLILQKLQQNISPQSISQELECCIDIIYDIAKSHNINIKQMAINTLKKSINQFDKNGIYIQTFDGVADAAKWCFEQGLSKGQVDSIRKKISGCINENASRKTAYGYIWKTNNEE